MTSRMRSLNGGVCQKCKAGQVCAYNTDRGWFECRDIDYEEDCPTCPDCNCINDTDCPNCHTCTDGNCVDNCPENSLCCETGHNTNLYQCYDDADCCLDIDCPEGQECFEHDCRDIPTGICARYCRRENCERMSTHWPLERNEQLPKVCDEMTYEGPNGTQAQSTCHYSPADYGQQWVYSDEDNNKLRIFISFKKTGTDYFRCSDQIATILSNQGLHNYTPDEIRETYMDQYVDGDKYPENYQIEDNYYYENVPGAYFGACCDDALLGCENVTRMETFTNDGKKINGKIVK